jgi:hypothetical protein
MDQQESQQIVQAILDQAREGKFTQFRLIENWYDFQECRTQVESLSVIIKLLNRSNSNLLKSYCKTVIAGVSDFEQILAYSEIQEVIDYYKVELDTYTRMVDEFYNYLSHGNLLYSFLGGNRFDD